MFLCRSIKNIFKKFKKYISHEEILEEIRFTSVSSPKKGQEK